MLFFECVCLRFEMLIIVFPSSNVLNEIGRPKATSSSDTGESKSRISWIKREEWFALESSEWQTVNRCQ